MCKKYVFSPVYLFNSNNNRKLPRFNMRARPSDTKTKLSYCLVFLDDTLKPCTKMTGDVMRSDS